MSTFHPLRQSLVAVMAGLAVIATAPLALAATKAPAKKAAKPAEPSYPAASPEQIEASSRVYYGNYECEEKQTVSIAESAKYPAYAEVKQGKAVYLMKPVASSTGAIRLEDVRGETLMVQIATKSMLLNVKTAHRIANDCVSPKQREYIETAKAAAPAESTLAK